MCGQRFGTFFEPPFQLQYASDDIKKYGIKNPVFKPSPIKPRYDDYVIFEGISVDEDGGQHYLDVHVAYRQACLNAIEYMTKFGYTKAQAYAILGCAPAECPTCKALSARVIVLHRRREENVPLHAALDDQPLIDRRLICNLFGPFGGFFVFPPCLNPSAMEKNFFAARVIEYQAGARLKR